MLDFDALLLAPNHATFGEVNQGYPTPAYTPAGSETSYPIDGVFRIESIDVLAQSDAPGVTTRKPMLDIRASQVPAGVTIAQGGIFVVRGVAYYVADVQPDGMGLLSLRLTEQ